MRTIRMTLDDELVGAVKKANAALLEEKHKKGYERRPAGAEEFSLWETEQEWGD